MEHMDPEDAAKAMIALERQKRLKEETEARERAKRRDISGPSSTQELACKPKSSKS